MGFQSGNLCAKLIPCCEPYLEGKQFCVDAFLYNNHSHARPVVWSKLFKTFSELLNFVICHCGQITISNSVTEDNDPRR